MTTDRPDLIPSRDFPRFVPLAEHERALARIDELEQAAQTLKRAFEASERQRRALEAENAELRALGRRGKVAQAPSSGGYTVQTNRLFKCSHCDAWYVSPEERDAHQRREHRQPPPKPVQGDDWKPAPFGRIRKTGPVNGRHYCPVCGEGYFSERGLAVHRGKAHKS